jgi:hypothetical protein
MNTPFQDALSRLTGAFVGVIDRPTLEARVGTLGGATLAVAPYSVYDYAVTNLFKVMPRSLAAAVVMASGIVTPDGQPSVITEGFQELCFDNTGAWVATFETRHTSGSVYPRHPVEYRLSPQQIEKASQAWYYVRGARSVAEKWVQENIPGVSLETLQTLVLNTGILKSRMPLELHPWVEGLTVRRGSTFEVHGTKPLKRPSKRPRLDGSRRKR